MDLHECLRIVPRPLLETSPFRKSAESREWRRYSDPRMYITIRRFTDCRW